MKKAAIILLFILFACISKQPKQTGQEKKTPLEKFLRRCELDVTSAIDVITEKDIVKNLTHLQTMNMGGRKYYLLERENITKMINAVTKGVYSDYILINRGGTVIYTKFNNDIFGKNVRTSLRDTVLYECYVNRGIPRYFGDVTFLTDGSRPCLYVSSSISDNGEFNGIFVLETDVRKLQEIMGSGKEIIGFDGLYKVPNQLSRVNERYPLFEGINVQMSGSNKENLLYGPGSETYRYRFFKYRNLNWIIITDID